jgi:hypothetical protein
VPAALVCIGIARAMMDAGAQIEACREKAKGEGTLRRECPERVGRSRLDFHHNFKAPESMNRLP